MSNDRIVSNEFNPNKYKQEIVKQLKSVKYCNDNDGYSEKYCQENYDITRDIINKYSITNKLSNTNIPTNIKESLTLRLILEYIDYIYSIPGKHGECNHRVVLSYGNIEFISFDFVACSKRSEDFYYIDAKRHSIMIGKSLCVIECFDTDYKEICGILSKYNREPEVNCSFDEYHIKYCNQSNTMKFIKDCIENVLLFLVSILVVLAIIVMIMTIFGVI